MSKLFFTIATPRAGKSTFCNKWVLEPSDRPFPRVIIAGDDFRLALHGQRYTKLAEGQIFASMDLAVRALLLRGHQVIIDETCTSVETLRRYLKIDLDATPIWINTPTEVCIERAIACNQADLIKPIQRMAIQLEYLKSHFDDIVDSIKKEILEVAPRKY